MEDAAAQVFLRKVISDVKHEMQLPEYGRFGSLRAVDSKVREVRIFLQGLKQLPTNLYENMEADVDFQANSRRVRLEALCNYCQNAITFLESGIVNRRVQIVAMPDVSSIARVHPQLESCLGQRWLDAQKCRHQKCYLASVILMGSILEGLLLARVSMDPPTAYRSVRAPKDKAGNTVRYQEWNLSALIDVAVDVGWLKTDRGKFGHALRDSRNVVHPWVQIASKADFDESTCATSWEVLKASVNDLLASFS